MRVTMKGCRFTWNFGFLMKQLFVQMASMTGFTRRIAKSRFFAFCGAKPVMDAAFSKKLLTPTGARSPLRGLAWVLAASGLAVTSASPAAEPTASLPSPALAPSTPSLPRVTAFDGYLRWQDATPRPWVAQNDLVRRRGGWRAYAREMADAVEPTPATAPSPTVPSVRGEPPAPAYAHGKH